MEPILQFFEQYWGYTLFGGVTVGTLVVFIITAVKFIVSNVNLKDGNESLKTNINNLLGKLSEQSAQLEATKKQLQETVIAKAKQNEYFNKVQSTTFEALSYLLMASKLPAEDKASMMKKFNELTNTTEEQVVLASTNAEVKITNAVSQVNTVMNNIEDTKEKAQTAVAEIASSVEKAQSLLDKYNNTEANV